MTNPAVAAIRENFVLSSLVVFFDGLFVGICDTCGEPAVRKDCHMQCCGRPMITYFMKPSDVTDDRAALDLYRDTVRRNLAARSALAA